MKYLFVVFNAAALIIAGWVLTELPAARDGSVFAPRGAGAAALPEIEAVTEQDRKRLAQARDAMDSVAELMRPRDSGLVTDALLATADPPAPEPEPAPESPERAVRAPLPERELTLVLDGDTPMAMVDGELVRDGDAVPAGGTVARIEPQRVVIEERDGRRQALTLPAEDLRVGTLRPGERTDNVN